MAAPDVAITSPAHNAQVTAGTVTFRGTASSGAGVARVELAMDGSFASYRSAALSQAGASSVTWSINYNIPSGYHYLVARVTDNSGRQDWHSITVNGVAGSSGSSNGALNVSAKIAATGRQLGMYYVLTGPGGQQQTGYTPASISLAAGQGYSINLSNYQQYTFERWEDNGSTSATRAFTAPASGGLNLVAIYRDATVSGTPGTPTAVQITSPATNAQVTAGTVTFRGTASSGAGVARVELAMDGNAASYRAATLSGSGSSVTWSIGYSVPAGSHWFVARVTDNAGAQQWHSISLTAAAASSGGGSSGGGGGGSSTGIRTGNSVFDQYDSLIVASAQRYGFPNPMIIKAQMAQESDFKSWVASRDIPCGTPGGWTAEESHSYGLMQITPACNPPAYALLPNGHPNMTQDTGSQYWPTSVFNPAYNTDFAVRAMDSVYDYMKSRFPGCTEGQYMKMSLGAYNSGNGSVYGCGSWNDRANTYINYVMSKYQYLAGMAGMPTTL
ncbi:Ig-like domain-containing protein [Nitrososphaera sp.]|uniref:Ig-like domain-containing protein n=1 Tax=Nitrososphaera sp. TaxID=1971748 RepID=UPI00307E5BD1